MSYQIRFRVMGKKGGNWIMIASFAEYTDAESKINSIAGGFEMLEIRKVWILASKA